MMYPIVSIAVEIFHMEGILRRHSSSRRQCLIIFRNNDLVTSA